MMFAFNVYAASPPHSVWLPSKRVAANLGVNVVGFWHMSGPLTPHLDMLRSMPNSKRQRHIASSQPMKVNIFLLIGFASRTVHAPAYACGMRARSSDTQTVRETHKYS